jgi:hypothetical protein
MRTMAKAFLCSVAVAIALAQSASSQQAAATRCATPMHSGFDWPASPVNLWKISGGINSQNLNIPGKVDLAAQRLHGWMLFAGATQPANNQPNAQPVFHTWYTTEESFDPTPGKIDCNKRHPLRLTLPTQLVMVTPNPVRSLAEKSGINVSPRFDPNPGQFTATDASIASTSAHDGVIAFSHVAFNQEMYDWLRDNEFYSKTALNRLIDSNVSRKPITPVPTNGISLKFSWWPVAPDRLTPVPVWDNDPRFPGDAKNPPTSWKRVVLVDPVGGLQIPPKVTLGGFDHSDLKSVPLGQFYSVQVSKEEADLANSDFRIKSAATAVLGRPLQAGDFIVMTALHIATREFPPWVFTTFWWSDNASASSLGKDMPASVKGAFRNYIMDVSYNINNPKGPGGKAPVSYNPWLELFQRGGTRSQCMACHARASYGPNVQAGFNPPDMSTKDPNGFDATPQSASDPNFAKGTLDLDRVWTIFTRAE